MRLLLSLLLFLPLCAAEVRKPNILIILADDLGYGDVQCYNTERGKIPTPNIDKLGSQGMRFTDGHSSSGVCTPSRYTRHTWHLVDGIHEYTLWRPFLAEFVTQLFKPAKQP